MGTIKRRRRSLDPKGFENLFREVNNAAVPDVNFLDQAWAEWLVSHSFFPRLATLDGKVAGVIIVLSETAGFDNVPSLNFHRKMGYQEVGTQFCEAEGKTVCKFMKYVERAKEKVENLYTDYTEKAGYHGDK